MNLKKKPQNGKIMKEQQQPTGFKDLLNAMMERRWYITAAVLGGFILIIAGIFVAVSNNASMAGEWKELLMLLLGAFIGSYGKIIDYWFSDTDKDKMLVQKMDEEDGVTMSHTNDMKETNKPYTPIIPDAFVKGAERASEMAIVENKQKHEIARDEQEHRQALEIDEQEHEQEMEKLKLEHEIKAHRQCDHVFADVDHDGDYECIHCGKIKE
jgi:hypothetical protein